jgi:hypothetical protein
VLAALLLLHARVPRPGLVLAVILATSVIRMLLDMASFFGVPVSLPGLPVFLPAAVSSSVDLRTIAPTALPLCLALTGTGVTRARRFWAGVMTFAVLAGIVFGASRIALIRGLFIVLFYMFFQRRTVWLLSLMTAGTIGALAINMNPELLYKLPQDVRRSFISVVVPSDFTDIHKSIEGSNRWHFDLAKLGFRRWTRGPATYAVGNAVKAPYVDAQTDLSYEEMIEQAVNMGGYESGLWTVLAILGSAGAVLYSLVLWKLTAPLVSTVWRRRVSTPALALAFLALTAVADWLVFSPMAGGFPTLPLPLMALARAAIVAEDADSPEETAEAPVAAAGRPAMHS